MDAFEVSKSGKDVEFYLNRRLVLDCSGEGIRSAVESVAERILSVRDAGEEDRFG
jgi:hypothetical protein